MTLYIFQKLDSFEGLFKFKLTLNSIFKNSSLIYIFISLNSLFSQLYGLHFSKEIDICISMKGIEL